MSEIETASRSKSATEPKFTTEQQSHIDTAMADPRDFIFRRLIEAIVASDGDKYNSFMCQALQSSASRGLDLMMRLVQAQPESSGSGKPSAAEVMAAQAAAAVAAYPHK